MNRFTKQIYLKKNKTMPFKCKLFFTLYIIGTFFVFSQTDTAPSITAEGQQIYCVGTPIPIVTNFTIEDPDGTGVQNFFIQISGDIK